MRFRKLRIAWSVAWGTIALLLVTLWMGSISHAIYICLPAIKKHCIFICPMRNALFVGPGNSFNWHAGIEITSPPSWWPGAKSQVIQHGPFAERATLLGPSYGVSLWLPIALSCSLASLSWFHWRFSLRTLLIAMTLTAVVLGLIVWMARK
jgi:hypothetical protein